MPRPGTSRPPRKWELDLTNICFVSYVMGWVAAHPYKEFMENTDLFENKKRVHFISLGCPKNLVDSEIMAGTLMKDGYEVVAEAEEADTVIVNTCGFIEDSKKESIQKILEVSELKTTGSVKRVVVAGCLTQRYKNELVEGLPEADLFYRLGRISKHRNYFKRSY